MSKEVKKHLKQRSEKNRALKFILVTMLALAAIFGFVWLAWFFLYY